MKDFWNARYKEEHYAYGLEPNAFLASNKDLFKAGQKVLVVGDGEGRNGVWLAEQGLDVMTVDYSQSGVDRSKKLAAERNVKLTALCQDLTEWDWPENEFDWVVSIYLHFGPDLRTDLHRKMLAALKPGGRLLMEAFNKGQLKGGYPSGGPQVESMLFSMDELVHDFKGAKIELIEELVVALNEGKYHVGDGAVVRLILQK